MTARTLFTRSLRLIGQLSPGRVANASELATALEVCNGMLDVWRNDEFLVYTRRRDIKTLTAAKASYTVGPSGEIDIPRPLRVDYANLLSDGDERELDVLTLEEWRLRRTSTGTPDAVFLDGAYPLPMLYVDPAPDLANYTLELYTWSPLPAIANLDATIDLPPGYNDLIAYQLALRLAPEWAHTPRPDVIETARATLAEVQATNAPVYTMTCDIGLRTTLRRRGYTPIG